MPRKPLRKALVIALLVAVVLLVVVVIPYALGLLGRQREFKPGEASGDALDIRLAGVIPDFGADLYDAAGKRIEPCAGVADSFFQSNFIVFVRLFVFNVPNGADNVVVAPVASCRPAGESSDAWESVGSSMTRLAQPVNGRCVLALTFARERQARSSWPWPLSILRGPSKKTVTDVDLALRYWYGPRGEADYTFEGPFEDGAEIAAGPDGECRLVVRSCGGGKDTDIEIKRAPDSAADFLVYDDRGQRLRARARNTGLDAAGAATAMHVDGLPPGRIGFITVGEKPSERVFHNVAVFREDWPDSFAEYKAAIKDRVGDDGGINEFWAHFKSDEAAMAAVDLLWGQHIAAVLMGGFLDRVSLDPEVLDAATREAAIETARRWLAAWDPRIRGAGACLGGLLIFEQFRDEVFESLGSDDDYARSWAVSVFWRLREKLTGEDVRLMTEVLLKRGTPEPNSRAFSIIRESQLSEAGEAMLAFALDERPEFWCHGLADARAVDALGPFDKWPEELRVRRYIAMGREGRQDYTLRLTTGEAATRTPTGGGAELVQGEALAKAAAAVLPSLLRHTLAERDRAAFRTILDATAELSEKDAAIAAIVALLRDAVYDRRCDNWAIDAVKYLNGLAGVNIAHIGSDFNRKFQVDPAQAAADAVEWYETGELPVDIPEGYRAKAGDLRVIIVEKESGEARAIGLYMSSGPGTGSRQQVLEFPGGPAFFRIRETAWRDQRGPTTQYSVRVIFSNGMILRHATARGLPCVFSELKAFEVHVEYADSPESAISGTKVFEDWWQKYGPVDPMAAE